MKVALCQLLPKIGKIGYNTDMILDAMHRTEADIYIFPELFLTDYTFTEIHSIMDDVDANLRRIHDITSSADKAVVVGGPFIDGEKIFNSAYVISDDIKRYDKINLPNFGPFAERKTFAEGERPLLFEFKGFTFGAIICYDIFFPELTKLYAMNGADAVICISASPVTSNTAFERVLPARSVESTVYMIFVNNTGEREGMTFFGRSRCLSPTGDTLEIAGSEEAILTAELDRESIDFSRIQRPTLADTRVWMANCQK